MQESSEKEFVQLIDTYSRVLLNRAYYLLSNKEDAEDLVQDVFCTAYINYSQYENRGAVLSWLMGILYNKAMKLYKERYKSNTNIYINFTTDFNKYGEWRYAISNNNWFGEDPSEHEILLDNLEFREHFYNCLEDLPERWRVIVKLCYLDGNRSEYICSELGITITNYWKLLQRSRLQLRKCLDAKWFNI